MMVLFEDKDIVVVVVDRDDLSALLSLPGFVVLEPVKHILALDLAVEAELRRDLLNLVGARSSQTGPEEIGQDFDLLARRVPTTTLCSRR